MKKNKIFVQIASYRDPELLPTLRDLIDKAKNPEHLHICIAHQFDKDDEWDNLNEFKNDNKFTIIEIPYQDSLGACWARNQIQQHYNDEEFTFQLDSHHRFVENWDTELKKMYRSLVKKGHKKPLITSYIPSYNPKNDPDSRVNIPWGMSFDRFTPEGVVFFLPYYLDKKPTEPVPARFYSAHFAFTTGKFCIEVPHDPKLYFHGEEISIAVRAYTHGYDLFHSHKLIAWHEYTREGRKKNWDDHTDWGKWNTSSHSRMRALLGVDGVCSPCNRNSFKGYNIGEERTIAQYEEYSGIRFKDRAIKQSTLNNELPGINDGEQYNPKFKHAIDLYAPDFVENDYTFAAVILENEKGEALYRKDDINFQRHLSKKDWFVIWVEANVAKPHKWIVWAHSESKGWAEKKETLL